MSTLIETVQEPSIDKSIDAPALSVVKPRQKECLRGDQCAKFESLFSDSGVVEPRIKAVENVPHSYIIDNVLSEEECRSLRREIDQHPVLSFWCEGRENDADTRSFRNVRTIELYSHRLADSVWKRIEGLVKDCLHVCLDNEEHDDYERELEGDWVPSGLNPDSLFARYPSHGSFAPHTDGRAIVDFNRRSHFSVILYLNSIPLHLGGGTRFYEKSAVKKLVKGQTGENEFWTADESLVIGEVEAIIGRMLIFHQSLVHEGVPPVSPHEKYIIRSDIISTRTPAVCDSAADREAYEMFRRGENLVENGEVEEGVKLFKRAFKLSPLMAQIMGQG